MEQDSYKKYNNIDQDDEIEIQKSRLADSIKK